MADWLYRIQPVRPAMLSQGATPDEQRLVGEHFAYLHGLTERGIVKLAGRTSTTDSASFGIVLFEADDLAAAEALVAGDPAVRERVFRAELFPFSVALAAR